MFNQSTFNPSTTLQVVQARQAELVRLANNKASEPGGRDKRTTAGFAQRVVFRFQEIVQAILRRRNQAPVRLSNG